MLRKQIKLEVSQKGTKMINGIEYKSRLTIEIIMAVELPGK